MNLGVISSVLLFVTMVSVTAVTGQTKPSGPNEILICLRQLLKDISEGKHLPEKLPCGLENHKRRLTRFIAEKAPWAGD